MIGMVYNVIFFQCALCHLLESKACLRKKHTLQLNMGNVRAGASVHGWWECLSMENQGRSWKGLSVKGRKSLDGTQMKRAKGWGGFMSTCLDSHSTRQYSGTHGGGDAQHSSPSGSWTLSRRAFRSVFCLPNWIISLRGIHFLEDVSIGQADSCCSALQLEELNYWKGYIAVTNSKNNHHSSDQSQNFSIYQD